MSKRVDYYYLDTQRKRKLVSRWSEKKKRNIKVYQYQTKKTVKKTKRKLVNLIKRYQTLFRSVNQLYAEILELRGTRDRKQKGVLAKLKQRKLTIEKSIETLEKVLIYQVDHEQKMTKSSVDSLNRKLKPHLNALLDFDVQIKSSEERALKNQEKIENLKEKLEEYNSWLKTQSKIASKEQSIVGEPMSYREIQQVHGWQKQRWQKYQWSVELKKSVEAVIASLGQLQKKEEVVATHYGEYVKVLSLVSKVQAEIQVLQKKKRSVFEKKMSQALLNAFDNLHDLYERGEENSRPSLSRSFSGEKVWIKKQLAALNQKMQKKFAEVSSPEEKLYAQLVCANEALSRSHCLSIQEIGSRRQRLWFFKSLPEEGEGGRRELLSTIGVNAGAVIWDKQVSKVEHLDVAVEKAMKSIDHNQIQKWWVEKEYWAWKLRVASMENRVLRDYSRQHPSSNISRSNFRFSAELYEYYMNKYKRFFQSIDKKEARKLSQQQHLQKVLRDKLSVYESVWQDYKSLSDQIVEGVGRKVKRLARLAQAPSLFSRCEGASFNHLNEAEKCQKQGKRMLPELERFSAKIYHQYYEMTLVLLMSTLHEVESLKTEAVLIQSEITNRKKIRGQYVELNNLKGLRNIKKSLEAYLDKVKQQIELNEDAKALQEKGLKSVVARIDKKTKIYSELKKKLHERLSYMKKNQQVMTRSCKDVHQLYMSRDAEHDKLYQQLPFFVEKESLPRSYCKFDLVTPMGWVFE